MRPRPLLVLAAGLLALTCVSGASAAAGEGCPAIAGAWRGASTCLDRSIATSCTDEQVRFRFLADAARPASLTVHAEKLVGGQFVSMGDAGLACDPASRTWVFEIPISQARARWSYGLRGDALAGELVAQPSGTVIRRVTARREGSSG